MVLNLKALILISVFSLTIQAKSLESLPLESESDYIEFTETSIYDVMSFISDKYKIDIIVSDELKDKKMSGKFRDYDLKSTLDNVCWLLNTQYIYKNKIYFFGGKNIVYEIKNSAGFNADLKSQFGENVSIVSDKVVIKGSEKEVKNINDTFEVILNIKQLSVYLYIYSYSYTLNKNLGLDFKPVINGSSISYDDIKNNTVEQSLFGKPKIDINLKTEYSEITADLVYNSQFTLVSGRESLINIGQSTDRQIFTSVPTTTASNSFVTSYQTVNYGLTLRLKAFEGNHADWILQSFIESSDPGNTANSKNLVQLNNNYILKAGRGFTLADIQKDSTSTGKSNFFQNYFSWLDWLFPEAKTVTKNNILVYIFIE